MKAFMKVAAAVLVLVGTFSAPVTAASAAVPATVPAVKYTKSCKYETQFIGGVDYRHGFLLRKKAAASLTVCHKQVDAKTVLSGLQVWSLGPVWGAANVHLHVVNAVSEQADFYAGKIKDGKFVKIKGQIVCPGACQVVVTGNLGVTHAPDPEFYVEGPVPGYK